MRKLLTGGIFLLFFLLSPVSAQETGPSQTEIKNWVAVGYFIHIWGLTAGLSSNLEIHWASALIRKTKQVGIALEPPPSPILQERDFLKKQKLLNEKVSQYRSQCLTYLQGKDPRLLAGFYLGSLAAEVQTLAQVFAYTSPHEGIPNARKLLPKAMSPLRQFGQALQLSPQLIEELVLLEREAEQVRNSDDLLRIRSKMGLWFEYAVLEAF